MTPRLTLAQWRFARRPGAEIERSDAQWFMHERISARIPGYGEGRKWAWDWQAVTTRCAWTLNEPGRLIDSLPAHLVGRFGHRVRDWGPWA